MPRDEFGKLFVSELANSRWRTAIEAVVTLCGWIVAAWLWIHDAPRGAFGTVAVLSGFACATIVYDVSRRVFAARELAHRKAAAEAAGRVATLEKHRASDFTVEGWRLRPLLPDQGEELWFIVSGITFTNRSDHQVPLELSINIGFTSEGNSQYFESAFTLDPPDWLKLKVGIRSERQFTRFLNLPGRSATSGYCVFDTAQQLLAGAGVSTVDELVAKCPIWFEVTNKLTNEWKQYALNPCAHFVDQAAESKRQIAV